VHVTVSTKSSTCMKKNISQFRKQLRRLEDGEMGGRGHSGDPTSIGWL
jgi:hypothetical protein